MAGIPIYTESPISPAKATAITPQTIGVPPSPYAPATATATPTSTYAPAQPASGLPTPTHPAPAPATSTATPTPTPTTSSPPAPQPGALPTPFVPKSRTPSPRREIPPPPKVGEKAQPPSYYSPTPTPTYFAAPQPFPPQVGLPPPTDPRSAGIPPASTTSTTQQPNGYGYMNGGANGLLSPQSARIPYGQQQPQTPGSSHASPAQTPLAATAADARRSLEHPPGYVQNPYAADMTPEQRFATAHNPGSPSLGWNASGPAKSPGILGTGVGLTGLSSPVGGLGGILNGGGETGEESVWGMVGGWMKGVGRRVGELEESAWRKINGRE